MTDTQDAQDFRALAMAALRISGNMLDAASPEVKAAIDAALRAGARFELAFEVPGLESLRLDLVEIEGARRTLATLAIGHANLQ